MVQLLSHRAYFQARVRWRPHQPPSRGSPRQRSMSSTRRPPAAGRRSALKTGRMKSSWTRWVYATKPPPPLGMKSLRLVFTWNGKNPINCARKLQVCPIEHVGACLDRSMKHVFIGPTFEGYVAPVMSLYQLWRLNQRCLDRMTEILCTLTQLPTELIA